MTNRTIAPAALALLLVACGAESPAPVAPTPPPVTSAPRPVASASPSPPAPIPASVVVLAEGAVLFDDLGTLHHGVTASPEAQKWFDQGLRLTYGFNHDEATRSFAKGTMVDPTCAMCFWGAALTMGPNYNMPMLPDRAKAAWEALGRAKDLAPGGTAVEQALIGALAARYKGPDPLDPEAMQPFNVAYAAAMKNAAAQYADDDDVLVLAAEAQMDTNPWKLWSLDGKAADGTDWIVTTLETVLARSPKHPGANHYYIHAVEASLHPEKAEPSADRLAGLIPGAGHIVHMPAHIYQRVGRYADASNTNENAVRADQAYMQKTKPPGVYPMYLAHNYGFLSFSASMEGRSATSIQAAREAVKALPPGMIDMMPGMDFFAAEPPLAMVRFGKWDDLLAEPKPDAKYPVLTAFWLHGHGMALVGKGKAKEAQADLDALKKMADSVPAELKVGMSPAKTVFGLAAKILEARIASVQKKPTALGLWEEAVKMSDTLAYSEPDDWFYSVRTFQGGALLAAGKAKEAEAVYREDLHRKPKNGWSLFGLWKSLEAEHKAKDAAAAKGDFEKAWAKADVKLTSSAF
jgi:tetratricopeptide (TPR) repeat protein